MPLREQVASNVRAELAANRMTAADLSRILHVGYRAALRRFNGEQEIGLGELATIAAALQVPVSAFLAPRPVERAVA
ncbi:hypothetical protein DEI86_13700 [Curtobacterium sp. MCBD17_028]|nr:hypothetical protein DEI86_13700 [Curtobacterium sp. MCBD17_028]